MKQTARFFRLLAYVPVDGYRVHLNIMSVWSNIFPYDERNNRKKYGFFQLFDDLFNIFGGICWLTFATFECMIHKV